MYIVHQCIVDEINISDKHQLCTFVIELIQAANLIKTVKNVGPFYPRLIQELIVNLSANFNDPVMLNIKRYMFVEYATIFLILLLISFWAFLYLMISLLLIPLELSGSTIRSWPADGQLFVVSLKHRVCHSAQGWYCKLDLFYTYLYYFNCAWSPYLFDWHRHYYKNRLF